MSGEQLTGQDTPVVDEAHNLTPQETGNPEAQTDGAAEKDSPAPKTFTQAELEAIVAREKAKAERKALREAAKALQPKQAPQEPKREDFANDERYTQAQLEYLAEQKAAEKLAQREQDERLTRQREALEQKAEAAAERYPDFHLVVGNPALPINAAMAEYIADSDHGADVAYFLGKNPAKAAAIAQMSPVRAARELTRIEAELAARPKAAPSKAPDPIKPVGSRGAPSASKLPSDDDDIDTWMRKERERVKQR